MSEKTLLEEVAPLDANDYSRRQVMTWLLACAAASSLSLVGCGGSSLFSSGPLKSLTATITLPAGVAATDLLATSSKGNAALAGDRFGIEVLRNVPSLVMALNATTFKMVHMAVVDPDAGDPTLDSRSSAIALMYLGVGGAMLSDGDRNAFLDEIAISPKAAELAAAIDLAQSSDPYVLSNGDPVLKAKVQDAIQSFVASRPGHGAQAAGRPRELASHLLIEPAAEVEGMTVVQGSSDLQYQVQNVRRRTGTMMTYRVSHEAENGSTTPENPPVQVGEPLYIPSTRNILSLPYGWSQVTSAPATVAVTGSDVKTKYEAIIINTVFNGTTPSFYSDPKYASFVPVWQAEAARLRQTGILQGLANLVLEVMGLGGTIFTTSSLAALLPGIASRTTSLEAAMVSAAAGNVYYEFVVQELLSLFTAEQIFAVEMPSILPLIAEVNAARAAELAAAQASSAAIQLVRAGLLVLVVLGVIEVADVIAVALDTHGGNEANMWSLTAFQPQVTLNPGDGTYTPGSSKTISVSAPGIGTEGVTYHWQLAGSSLANLSDGSHVGNDFSGTNSTVNLATTPSTQGNLTVTATVIKNGEIMGSASATYSVQTGLPVQYMSWLRPGGGEGLCVFYMEIMLQATDRTSVRMSGVNNLPGHDGATAAMTISFPPISEPIYPLGQDIVWAQVINITQMINQGYVTNMSSSGDENWMPAAAFQLISYGDRVLLWVGIASWWPGAIDDGVLAVNEAQARARAEALMAQVHYTVEIL